MKGSNRVISHPAWRELSKVRPGLLPLMVFTALLGAMNILLVNQKVVLYVFYLPVIVAAWTLRKRHAVSVAILAAVLVAAFAFFLPESLVYSGSVSLLWAELLIWGGILVVTAYVVSTLRAWTEEAMRSLERAYSGVLAILSKFIETIDADTEAHCVRVAAWSISIARELGLKSASIEELRIAALLHDVGKVNISVGILRKAAALSADERQIIQEHTTDGASLVRPIGGMLASIADIIEAHHENYDGTGNAGLKGEAIPLAARIIAVADVFDALLSDRPYRKSIGVFNALDNIVHSTGSKFDPKAVEALQHIINRGGEEVIAEVLQGTGRMLPVEV
ncbi:MAG: HD-GYP domain-containing protein [Sedimentisphaerales bacterium]|nr:HD-GYP domain-containing protein [Sedimentisphaerales bacterium]HNY78327.1 HD-GYP domain-containing protein [Sedimentisphaerales bacterium]HOC63585.1 HD-GYP domain-containing protein [Sedimentisphaerales bacterium]HOH62794.1 HD-GYP domain-containing protein [Sedimentisphaerales bacterium]HQA91467.1 HD-GYP domain-containing protein [Sedimentisphaerales bacterium]